MRQYVICAVYKYTFTFKLSMEQTIYCPKVSFHNEKESQWKEKKRQCNSTEGDVHAQNSFYARKSHFQ